MINLDNLEPDWELASKHGKASLTGIPGIGKSDQSKSEICPCCYQFIYKDPIPLSVNPKQLEILGFGFPLFYIFLKNCIMLLLISICSYSAMALKFAIVNNYEFCYPSSHETPVHRVLASEKSCYSFMIFLARLQTSISGQEQVLRLTSFIVQLMFLIYMRDHIVKLQAYYDQRNILLSDFSVMLKKIPKQKYIQRKLKQFFSRQFESPHEIKQITLLPEYYEIKSLSSERLNVMKRLRKAYKKDEFNDEDDQDLQNLTKIDQAIMEEIMVSKQLAKIDQLQCEKVILVFNTQQQRQTIIKQFKKMDFSTLGPYFGVGSEKITIKQAPEPKQIIWENVNVQQKSKQFKYIFAWILTFLVLGIVTLGAYFIYDYKANFLIDALNNYLKDPDNAKYEDRYKRAIAVVYFALFFIIIFNKLVMSTLYHKITEFEKHETRSKQQFFFGLRYGLGLFFTTALMTLIVQALIFQNYFSHPYGVIEEETIMFFLNAFFVPLYWLLNPFNIARKVSRYFNYEKKYLTQKEANSLMEESRYDMGKRYAQIIQTMWFTFLYSSLIPIGKFISLLGFICYYWVDKYNLLRRSSLGGQISGKVVISSMKLLDFILILTPLGQLIFDLQMRHEVSNFTIACIVIGGVYILLPVDRIIQYVNAENFNMAEKSYEQIKDQLKDTYHTEHPIYRIIQADKLRRKILKKGLKFQQKNIRISLLQDYDSTISTGKQIQTANGVLEKEYQTPE